MEVDAESRVNCPSLNTDECQDYLTEYMTIKTSKQRRRYRAHFTVEYTEYRRLHSALMKKAKKFQQLEKRFRKEDESSPKYKMIMKKIVAEYNKSKRDLKHQKVKQRFEYLHDKLTHIKRLVAEFDQRVMDNQSPWQKFV